MWLIIHVLIPVNLCSSNGSQTVRNWMVGGQVGGSLHTPTRRPPLQFDENIQWSSTECNIPRILCVMMLFHPTFYNGCNYLSMLGCNLTILVKGVPECRKCSHGVSSLCAGVSGNQIETDFLHESKIKTTIFIWHPMQCRNRFPNKYIFDRSK